jgi:hypothetical protein
LKSWWALSTHLIILLSFNSPYLPIAIDSTNSKNKIENNGKCVAVAEKSLF